MKHIIDCHFTDESKQIEILKEEIQILKNQLELSTNAYLMAAKSAGDLRDQVKCLEEALTGAVKLVAKLP